MEPLSYFIYLDHFGWPHFAVLGGNTPYRILRHPLLKAQMDAHCAAFNECIARCINQRKDAGQPVFSCRRGSARDP